MCQEAERATEGEPVNFEVIDSQATEQERETGEDPNSESLRETWKQSVTDRQRHRQRIHVHPQALDHQVCGVKKTFA